MDIKYQILKNGAESLLSRLEDYENRTYDNEDKLKYDIHYEMSNLIAFYKTEFKDRYF